MLSTKIKKWLKVITITIGISFVAYLYVGDIIEAREKYMNIYNEGVSLLEDGDHIGAIQRFIEIPNYMEYKNIANLLEGYEVCSECGTVSMLEN